MSNFLAIATVTAMLGQTILPAIQAAVNGSDISTRRPDEPGGNNVEPRVNLFLFQVSANTAYRNADLPTRREDGTLTQRPQTALNLHYLLTFYGDETRLEPQRLLGAAVSRLHARPLLTPAAIRALLQNNQSPTDTYNFLLTSDLAEQIEQVKFTPMAFNLEELSKLWSVFFQMPYTLSMAYQASVVLIEEATAPQPALPVQGYNVYVSPFRQPIIESISPATGENRPILPDSTLILRGQNLRGDTTRIRIAGQLVAPADLTEREARLPLADVPAGSLRAGIQGLQVAHERLIGTPPTPHRGVESEISPFVLRPTVDDVEADADAVTLTLDPIVGRSQRVLLLLNRRGGEPSGPEAYSFPAPLPRANDAAEITIPIRDVAAGDYLVRVQVDGAESLLAQDENPASPTFRQYIGPLVTIP